MEAEPHPQTVKRRIVFYIPGFDPMPPNRYRELYRMESEKQAQLSDFTINSKRISSLEGVPRFEAKAQFAEAKISTEFRFLQWNDLVHREMNQPVYKSWLAMFKVAKVIAMSGALKGTLKLHFPPNIAGLYPFFMISFQILTAFFLGLTVALFIASLPLPASPILAVIALALIFWSIVNLWRKYDHRLMPYYMLHDLHFTCSEDGYTPKPLRERLEIFKTQITSVLGKSFDEVLVVGHSSGAHLAVQILGELHRDGVISKGKEVSLLTLGHAVPMVSYLPKAHDLRLALDELSKTRAVKWVDITAPADGACFSLHDPVTSSIDINHDQEMPRVLSAAFRHTLSAPYYRTVRMRFFRLHFQYLCHFDRPGIYDYFRVTAGPITLWDRYGEMSNTPSLNKGNFNKFKDKAA